MTSCKIPPLPRSPTQRHRPTADLTYADIEQSITEMGNAKLSKFSEIILEQSENVERSKRFEIFEPEEIIINNTNHAQTTEEVCQMEERDKAISKQLAKIRALTYALEQEQKCIRLTLTGK